MSGKFSENILSIKSLSCGYGDKPVISGLSFDLHAGEIIAITGPNGCGKSTLLKAIYQLCIINTGDILWKERSLIGLSPEEIKKQGIAFFMQKNAIFPRLSVKENLYLAMHGMPHEMKKARTGEILSNSPDLGKWLHRSAGLLSGGQRQQLAFAMLKSQDAEVWLMDEPTAGLDVHQTQAFIDFIMTVREKGDKLILLVEHNQKVIHQLASKEIRINN